MEGKNDAPANLPAEVERQLALIRRGVEQIVPEDELRQKLLRSLKEGRPLRVKYGIDPTGIDVHLGHTVPLRKLRLFQELGHQAVLIIGNYTALIGDPSGRDQARVRLTPEQVEANARDYLNQISKVIDMSRTEVVSNGDWFRRFNFLNVISLCSMITVQRMLERDDFTKRLKAGTPIYLHECLYPLMQGFDSVMVRADIELGGNEQLFSLMAARDLQRDPPRVPDFVRIAVHNGPGAITIQAVITTAPEPLYNMTMGREMQSLSGQEPQVCITLPILRGLDGERRMGKSLGNYVGVGESAYDMFAKIMSIPDMLMREWFELLTDRSAAEIAQLTNPQVTHPMQAKQTLGMDIVSFYHGNQAAAEAAAEWSRRFSGRQDPTEIPEVLIPAAELKDGKMGIARLLVLTGLATSNNEARRSVQGGGVTIGPDREKVTDPMANVPVTDGLILRVGNRRVVRVRLR
jgi:tyrosyl-tRNA synthetase